jgi:3-hydroxypropionate dehydrogenase (NADP+)
MMVLPQLNGNDDKKKSSERFLYLICMSRNINRVACVGAGLIGQGWAALFLLHGYNVVLQDLSDERLKEAHSRTLLHTRKLVEYGFGVEDDYEKRLDVTTSLEKALEGVDFIQESVFESLDVKRPLYSRMDFIAPKDVVIASSTSGLMMTDIARDMKLHTERAIVAHPWNPVHLVPLVELSPGEKTSKETVEAAYSLMTRIGKVPVVLKKEAPGFIANRLSAVLWREALNLVETGVATVEDVDKAVKAGPGIRWAIMGPYLTYHLGGGKGGIEYLMRHIGVSKAKWLETAANWTDTPESAIQKAVEGVNDMVNNLSIEELEAWRDRYLVELNKLLWSEDPGFY